MSLFIPQASLAIAIAVSTIGTYIALTPPHPNTPSTPPSDDLIHKVSMTQKSTITIGLSPLGILALYASSLSYLYPNIPSPILGYGVENGLNIDLITWSLATFIPIALILFVGIPLRLISYASLGKNFTFALQEPDRLVTHGIYYYVQHPSYPGIVILVLSNMALLARIDGVMSCWIPPPWYEVVRIVRGVLVSVGLGMMVLGIWMRVRQEERMLRARFGGEWESWHKKTARFVPWMF